MPREQTSEYYRDQPHKSANFCRQPIAIDQPADSNNGGIMPKWEKLDEISAGLTKAPYSLYWSEAKSESEEFRRFLGDPLGEMVSVVSGAATSWSVQTTIIGHERGMSVALVRRLVLVDPRCKTPFL